MSTPLSRPIAPDCRFFLGDRPCVWHKREGALCRCDHYAPTTLSVLIIKLDAMGDVLRTTSALPALARKLPNAHITWITRAESVPLLRNNPHLAAVIAYGPDALIELGARRFDRVINLDAGRASAGLAAMTQSADKIGFVLDPNGHVRASNAAASIWLELGLYDDLKRANTRSYQNHMCAILDLPTDDLAYVLELTPAERSAAQSRLRDLGLDLARPIVAIHTGGGGRWPLKQWREEGFVQEIRRLQTDLDARAQILLFGGPLERELNRRITAGIGSPLFDAGCDNEVRHFAGLIGECAVVVCGDTLAMHVALAMKRRVVVLFGPTSHAEIELFGMGEKIIPDLGCLSCYKTSCDFQPNCMDMISVDMVHGAVLRQLALADARGAA